MNYIQWLKGNDCCEQINDCGCSGKDVCNCDDILLEISVLHTNDEILQNEIDNIASGSSVTVDDHLDSASTNPAQNKVITEALNGKLDASAYTPTDLSNYYTKEEVNSAITEVENDIPSLSGYATEQWVLDKNYITGVDLSNYATLQDIPVVPTDVSAFNNDAGYLTEHQSLSAYSTTDEVNSAINAATSGKADTTEIYNYYGGSGITVSTAAGVRNKKITLDVPIYKGDGLLSVSANNLSGSNNADNKINGTASFGAGYMVETKNTDEAAFGVYNISNGGRDQQFTFSSGNTLFSIGNGNTQNISGLTITKHNALEIMQNGDIYIADTNDTTHQEAYKKPMIKLQDILKSLQDQIDALRNG